jgi:hypothetical protein
MVPFQLQSTDLFTFPNGKEIFLFSKECRLAVGPFNAHCEYSTNLTAHIYIVPKLRICGAIPSLNFGLMLD